MRRGLGGGGGGRHAVEAAEIAALGEGEAEVGVRAGEGV